MRKAEVDRLDSIINGSPFQIRPELRKWREELVVDEEKVEEKGTRTSSQNNALHLWFSQIAEVCRDAGIDANLLMSKTIHVEVNEEIIKGMWKALQKALYGTTSTTELKKTGQIEKLQDHLIRFFGEKHNVELPPFPSDEQKAWEGVGHQTSSKMPEYPTDYKEPLV